MREFAKVKDIGSDRIKELKNKMSSVMDQIWPEEEETENEQQEEEPEENEEASEQERAPLGDISSQNQSKALLMSLLGPKETPIYSDINEVVEVDSTVINFGVFLPGKLLGSTLLVRNRTKQEQVLQMVMETSARGFLLENFTSDPKFNMLKEYQDQGEIVMNGRAMKKYQENGEILNSERKHACWFLENPQNKELVKHITLKLGPECE